MSDYRKLKRLAEITNMPVSYPSPEPSPEPKQFIDPRSVEEQQAGADAAMEEVMRAAKERALKERGLGLQEAQPSNYNLDPSVPLPNVQETDPNAPEVFSATEPNPRFKKIKSQF